MLEDNNKKLLLIKPDYFFFPMGLAYVCRDLKENNIPFHFLDAKIEKVNIEELLATNDYFAVATGGLSANWKLYQDIRNSIKAHHPKIPFILGGNVVKDTMYTNIDILFDEEKFGIDFGISGEAEGVLTKLLEKIRNNEIDYHNVPGLVYIDPITNKPRKIPKQRFDLNMGNRFPLWDVVDVEFYKKISFPFMGDFTCMPIMSGRGCKGACSFCSPTVGNFKARPLEHIMEEIAWLESNYEFEILLFLNEMFYNNKADILAFCAEYKQHFTRPWAVNLRASIDIDLETFQEMKNSGCIIASAGIESGSDLVLDLMKKQTPASKIVQFYRDAKTAGIPSAGTFIIANEGETEAELAKTIDMVIDEGMHTNYALMDAYPGTLAYKHALKKGLIKDEWYHLTKVAFRYSVWGMDLENEYVNTSAIADDVLWPTLYRQLRRFEKHCYDNDKLKNLTWSHNKSLLKKEVTNIKGECVSCGEQISSTLRFQPIGQIVTCVKCYYANFVPYLETPIYKTHYQKMITKLSSAKRILIVGLSKDLIKFNLFGIDYDNAVLGFIKTNDPIIYYPYSKDYSKRRKGFKTMFELDPDLIFIGSDRVGNAEIIIQAFFSLHGRKVPDLLHILPDEMRMNIKVQRFISTINSNQLRCLLFTLLNAYVKFITTLMNQINPDLVSFTSKLRTKLLKPSLNMRINNFLKTLLGTHTVRSNK